MNHPEEITKTSPNCLIKWVLKDRQQGLPKIYNLCLEVLKDRQQASSSSINALSDIRTWRVTRARTGLSPPAGYLYKLWDYQTTE